MRALSTLELHGKMGKQFDAKVGHFGTFWDIDKRLDATAQNKTARWRSARSFRPI